MEKSSNDHHISFFKPTTDLARFNKKLVLWLTSIWFVSIFGFHILMRIIEKPTPEPPLVAFQAVWDNVKSNQASDQDMQVVGQACLSVLGKIAITPEERTMLSQTMSWSILQQFPDSVHQNVAQKIAEFESFSESIGDINNPDYIERKQMLSKKLGPKLGLSELDARTQILPNELTAMSIESLSAETVSMLPATLEKYMVHNQSFLTDTKFLGFPFHYFYTAVFLLILFVGLCWIYCVQIDRRNVKLGIED